MTNDIGHGPGEFFPDHREEMTCPECGAQPNTFHAATCPHYISPEKAYKILRPDQGADIKSKLYDLHTGFAAEGALVAEQEIRDREAITGDLPQCEVLATFIDAFVKRYTDMSDERHVDIQLGGFGTAWVGSVKMSEIRALKKRLDALS